MDLLGATNKVYGDADNQANSGEINIWRNALDLVVDSALGDTEWYLIANGTSPITMGFLAGTGKAPVLKLDQSSLQRTSFSGILDIGLYVNNYKGLYRSTGTGL